MRVHSAWVPWLLKPGVSDPEAGSSLGWVLRPKAGSTWGARPYGWEYRSLSGWDREVLGSGRLKVSKWQRSSRGHVPVAQILEAGIRGAGVLETEAGQLDSGGGVRETRVPGRGELSLGEEIQGPERGRLRSGTPGSSGYRLGRNPAGAPRGSEPTGRKLRELRAGARLEKAGSEPRASIGCGVFGGPPASERWGGGQSGANHP